MHFFSLQDVSLATSCFLLSEETVQMNRLLSRSVCRVLLLLTQLDVYLHATFITQHLPSHLCGPPPVVRVIWTGSSLPLAERAGGETFPFSPLTAS